MFSKEFTEIYSVLDLRNIEAIIIDDDIDGDIGGAQHFGIKAYLVKTGKYNKQFAAASDIKPDLVIVGFSSLFGG